MFINKLKVETNLNSATESNKEINKDSGNFTCINEEKTKPNDSTDGFSYFKCEFITDVLNSDNEDDTTNGNTPSSTKVKQEKIYIKDEFGSNGIENLIDETCSSTKESFCQYVPHRILYKSITRNKNYSTDKNPKEKPLYECHICNFKTFQRCSLIGHKKLHSTNRKSFKCAFCNFKTTKKSYLTVHIRIHTGEKPFACSVCNFKANQKGDVTKHMRIHTGEEPYLCNLCDFRTKHEATFRNHMKKHTPGIIYTCNLCNFKSNQKNDLVGHVRMIHEGNRLRKKLYSCTLCSYNTGRKQLLTMHMEWHREQSLICKECSYKATDQDDLENHNKIHTSLIIDIRSRFSQLLKNS